jgi:hypothetical protein
MSESDAAAAKRAEAEASYPPAYDGAHVCIWKKKQQYRRSCQLSIHNKRNVIHSVDFKL